MKKLFTTLFAITTLALVGGGAVDAATLKANWGTEEDPHKIFVKTTTAQDAPPVAELEIDFYLGGPVGDQQQGKVDLNLKAENESLDIELSEENTVIITSTYSDGDWTLDFVDEQISGALKNINIYMALRDAEGKYLLGSMMETGVCNTLTSGSSIDTTTENCAPYVPADQQGLTLAGFSDETIVVGEPKKSFGTITNITYKDIGVYTMTLSKTLGPEGLVVTTSDVPLDNILEKPLPFDVTLDAYADIQLDVTTTATEPGEYTLSFVVNKDGEGENPVINETFTLTVNPKPFALEGFSDSFAYVNQSKEFKGTLVIPKGAAEGVYTMVLSGGDGSLTATSGGELGGENILGQNLTFAVGSEEGWIPTNMLPFNLPLDVTLTGTKRVKHDLTFTVTAPGEDEGETVLEQNFTFDVRNRGGGGGSSSSGSRPTTPTIVDTSVVTVGDTLVIDGTTYDLSDLTPAQEEIVVIYFQKQIILLLQQIIALMMSAR